MKPKTVFLERENNICDELKNKQGIIDTIIAHNTILLKSLHPPLEKPASEDITQKSIINNHSLNSDSKNDSENSDIKKFDSIKECRS